MQNNGVAATTTIPDSLITLIMPRPPRRTVKNLLILGLLSFAPVSLATNGLASTLSGLTPEFSDCTIGQGATSLVAQCATVAVPLDYSVTAHLAGQNTPDTQNTQNAQNAQNTEKPEGKQDTADTQTATDTDADSYNNRLELAIARIPARRRSGRHDVFTLIAGGPGQSAIESFPTVSFAFRHIMRDHDVILIDQRGTGTSSKLDCPDAPDAMGLDIDIDLATVSQQALECRRSLEHDPNLFTTSIAVQDIEWVRKALNISQWNLYGISYGTRVALHYLRRYPQAVRTMTLDAVVPPSIALGPDIGSMAQRALDLIFARCRDNAGCHEAFGDLSAPALALLDSLGESPRNITFEDVVTGQLTQMEFTREHLAITLRLMSYSAQTAAILPSMLHDAIVNENYAPLARQSLLQTRALGDSLATGMHHAIICTEDVPFIDADAQPTVSAGYLGDDIINALLASCEQWPAGKMDDDFKQPVVSAVPTLILSGEADPVTPPDYGNRVAEHLSAARHIVNPGQGHMQAPFGCMPVLLAQFVETADAQSLDIQCLERLRTLPFFIDANGPLP